MTAYGESVAAVFAHLVVPESGRVPAETTGGSTWVGEGSAVKLGTDIKVGKAKGLIIGYYRVPPHAQPLKLIRASPSFSSRSTHRSTCHVRSRTFPCIVLFANATVSQLSRNGKCCRLVTTTVVVLYLVKLVLL